MKTEKIKTLSDQFYKTYKNAENGPADISLELPGRNGILDLFFNGPSRPAGYNKPYWVTWKSGHLKDKNTLQWKLFFVPKSGKCLELPLEVKFPSGISNISAWNNKYAYNLLSPKTSIKRWSSI